MGYVIVSIVTVGFVIGHIRENGFRRSWLALVACIAFVGAMVFCYFKDVEEAEDREAAGYSGVYESDYLEGFYAGANAACDYFRDEMYGAGDYESALDDIGYYLRGNEYVTQEDALECYEMVDDSLERFFEAEKDIRGGELTPP